MTAEPAIRMYHRPVCPYCRRVRVYLAERGLEAELVHFDPKLHRQELERLNPKAQVPTCEFAGGPTLWDSTIIIQYVEETHPPSKLFPEDPAARARMRLLYDLSDHRLADTVVGFVRAPLDHPERPKHRDLFKRLVKDALPHLDPNGPFVEGATFSFADLSVPLLVFRVMEAGFRADELPERVQRWCEAVRERPTVRELFPPPA